MAVNEIDTSTEESLEIIDEKTTKSKTLNTKKQLKDIQLRVKTKFSNKFIRERH